MTYDPNRYQYSTAGYPQQQGYAQQQQQQPGYYTPPGYYSFPGQAGGQPQRVRHSGVGIASFIIALICGVGEFLLIVAAVAAETENPGVFDNEESPATMALGGGVMIGLLLHLVGLGLGIGGIAQRTHKRLFGVLGLAFNGGVLLLLLLLMLIGLAAEGA